MVYELNVVTVFLQEARRDILYDYLDVRRESPLAGDRLDKLDTWVGDELTGRQTYAVRFSLRFRNQAQRTAIITWFASNVKPYCLAFKAYRHLCRHDTGQPCDSGILIEQYRDAVLTVPQTADLVTAYEDL